jgi:hypothetical protein
MHRTNWNWSIVNSYMKWEDRLMERTRDIPFENRFLTSLQVYLFNVNIHPHRLDFLHILVDTVGKHRSQSTPDEIQYRTEKNRTNSDVTVTIYTLSNAPIFNNITLVPW